MKPRYCNRKGRPRAKQVVVERKLPVLANKADAGRQILQMNIVPQENLSQPRIIAPKILEIATTDLSSSNTINHIQAKANSNYISGIITSINAASEIETFNAIPQNQNYKEINGRTIKEPTLITDNATTPSRVTSPTNISNFIEMNVSCSNEILLDAIHKDKLTQEHSFAGKI